MSAAAWGQRAFPRRCPARPAVNGVVVLAARNPHNPGLCAREARQPREQGRNYAVPQGPAFLSSWELLAAGSGRFRRSQASGESVNSSLSPGEASPPPSRAADVYAGILGLSLNGGSKANLGAGEAWTRPCSPCWWLRLKPCPRIVAVLQVRGWAASHSAHLRLWGSAFLPWDATNWSLGVQMDRGVKMLGSGD